MVKSRTEYKTLIRNKTKETKQLEKLRYKNANKRILESFKNVGKPEGKQYTYIAYK